MNRINVKKLGLAIGITWALFYITCVSVMLILGEKGSVQFFNNLLHGLDATSIIRMNISFVEVLVGILESLILGWLTGAVIAIVYNFNLPKSN